MAEEEEDNLESSFDKPLSMSFMGIGKDGKKLESSLDAPLSMSFMDANRDLLKNQGIDNGQNSADFSLSLSADGRVILAPGNRFYQYDIEKKIGSGGMGEVFLAFDTQNNRKVAIKTLKVKSGSASERFRREHEFLKSVDHPNLIKAYDFKESDKELFLVMEFIGGEPLKELIEQGNTFSFADKIMVGCQIAQGIEALNLVGIIHRDIKPANIMVNSKSGTVKILDLGLGKDMDGKFDAELTQAKQILGSCFYMAPEQTEGQVTATTDIFALGTVLWEWFSGSTESPFFADNQYRVFMRIMTHEPAKLIDFFPKNDPYVRIYQRLSDMIAAAMHKDASKRIPKAGIIVQELMKMYQYLTSQQQQVSQHKWQQTQITLNMQQSLVQMASIYRDKDVGLSKSQIHKLAQAQNSEQQTAVQTKSPEKEYPTFGNYQIIEEIARGGMGIVYKVYQPEMKRFAALKILLGTEKAEVALIRRFFREAKITSQLQHPNIVPIYGMGTVNNQHYFVMKYVSGGSFENFIKKQTTYIQSLEILTKVCNALAFAHNKKVLHRDIKPSNIILDENNEPYIVDFGLAKNLDSKSALTQTGAPIGTAYYMSPEQVKSEKVDHLSDIYSIGVTLYFILTQQLPFDADTAPVLYNKILKDKPTPPSKINNSISPTLDYICLKCLSKNAKHRYSSADVVAKDIQKYLRNRDVVIWERDLGVRLGKVFGGKIRLWLLVGLSLFFLMLVTNTYISADKKIIDNVNEYSLGKEWVFSERLNYVEGLIKQEFFQDAHDILTNSLKQPNLSILEKGIIHEQLVITTSHLKKYDKTLFYYGTIDSPKIEVELAIAKTYYYLERYEESINIFNKIEENNQEKAIIKLETLMYKGLIAYHFKNYSDAIEQFKKVENILLDGSVRGVTNSYKTTVFLHLGNSYLSDKNYVLAQHYLEKAQKFLPDLSAIYEGLGKCCLATNLAVEAKNYFEKCIFLEPKNSFYYSYLGQALENLEKYEEANNMYLKALELDSSSFEGMRGLLTIPLKEVGVMEGNIEYMLFYINQARRVTVPDLLSSYMQQLVHNYHGNYLMWMEVNKKQEVSPENFLLRLTSEDILPEVYESIQKALLTLRYYPHIEELVNDVVHKSKDKAQLRILQTWEMIKKVKDQEQKFLTYYYMAKLYLKEEVNIPEENIKIAYDILGDTNESVIHRYLAGKTILENLDFETIEENATLKNQENFLPLICHIVLQEAGFPVKYPYYYFREVWEKDAFLSLLVAKNMGEDLKMWEYFKESSNPLILLVTAANLGQAKYAGIENVKEARKILARFTEDTQKDYLKVYAHYYLWKSYHIHKDKIVHEKIFIKGLHGNNTEIKKNILTYQSMFDTPKQWEDLANIMRNSNDQGVVHLAMTNLATHNIEHPVFNELIYGQKYVYSTRTMSFITRFFYIPASTPDERKVKIAQNLNLMFGELPKLKQDKAPQFRYVIYFLLAMTGFHSLDSLESEQDISVKAHIIINTRFKMMGRFKISNEYELKLIEPYLKSPHKEISKSAIAAFIALSSDEERENMFQSVMEQQDKSAMEGVAIGYYTLVKVPFLRTVNWQGTTNMFDKEEHYQSYIDLYTKFLDHEPLRKDCYRWLSNAIQLYPRAWYYYERSLIHILEKKYTEAIHDIQEALKLVPDSIRYTCTLAEVYYLQNNTAAAKACLQKLPSFKSLYHLLIMGDIYFKIGSYKDARNIFAKVCLLFPRKKDYCLRLAKCYEELGNEKYKNKYFDYAKAFLKK